MQHYSKLIKAVLMFVWILSAVGCSETKSPSFIEDYLHIDGVLLDVKPLSQFPHYPTGCESITAVMALKHAEINLSVDQFIDYHLTCSSDFYEHDGVLYGPDPYTTFAGDPRSENSYGCMAPVIEQALQSCLGKQKDVVNCCGMTLNDLCHTYVDAGTPVILWATMDMREATAGNAWYLEDGRFYVWTAGEHCLLLVGYNKDTYFFNDPRYGKTVAYDKSDTERAYAALGKQALIIQ